MCTRKAVIFPIILISIIASAFGYWFATQQLYAVTSSAQAVASYPKIYLFITIAKCYITIVSCYSLSWLLCAKSSRKQVSGFGIAISFLPLLGVFWQIPMAIIFGLTIVLLFSNLLVSWTLADYYNFTKKYSTDVLALFILFFLHLFLTTQFTPLNSNKALFTSLLEEIPIESPLYKGYSLAKQFAFSTFDYSEWGGVTHPPITLASPLSQFVTFIFNLPSIDPVTFHIMINTISFLLIIGGAFGCYLFLKYAAKVGPVFAWLGGFLMFFSVHPYLDVMLNNDGGIFLSSYAMLPYCFLALSLACEKQKFILAAWAGIAMAAPFFIMTPHPEGVIYTCLCVGLYGLGLVFFSLFSTWKKRLQLVACAFATFSLLSAYVVVPIMLDQLNGSMYTFAHTADIEANTIIWTPYKLLMGIFIPLSLLFITKRRDVYPVFLPVLFFCCLFNLIVLATSFIGFNYWIVNVLHVGMHIWLSFRITLFAVLGIYLVCMMCLDSMVRAAVNAYVLISPAKRVEYFKKISFILFVAKGQKNEI